MKEFITHVFIVSVCSLFGLITPAVLADEQTKSTILPSAAKPKIDGEIFEKISIAPGSAGNKLIEYVRAGESFEKWTKLVGYSYKRIPGLGNDPAQFAEKLGQTVKSTNPGAQYQISKNETTGSIMIDFLTWPKDGSYMEFNIFRLERAPDGNGIYSLQLAKRFPFFKDATEESVAPFRELRKSWLQQTADFDMTIIERLLN